MVCAGGHDVCDGGVGACAGRTQHAGVLRGASFAARVRRGQRLHRGHHGARAVPRPHQAIPLPEGNTTLYFVFPTIQGFLTLTILEFFAC